MLRAHLVRAAILSVGQLCVGQGDEETNRGVCLYAAEICHLLKVKIYMMVKIIW